MPKLSGIFAQFPNLEKISIEEIQRWPYSKAITLSITNFVANRVLYPQAISLTKADLETDFLILKEFVRKDPNKFYSPNIRKILITEEMERRFPPLQKLITCLVEAISPIGITTLMEKTDVGNIVLGTAINPLNLQIDQSVDIWINNKAYKGNLGKLVVFPTTNERHVRIKIGSLDEILVAGGKVGVVVDLRRGL